MTRLIAPNGSVVNVPDDFAERLVGEQGYKAAEDKKAPAKKAASSKSPSDES